MKKGMETSYFQLKLFSGNCKFIFQQISFNNYFSDGSKGRWDTEGCLKVMSTKDFTQCSCNHLTNFALLTAVSEFRVSFKS